MQPVRAEQSFHTRINLLDLVEHGHQRVFDAVDLAGNRSALLVNHEPRIGAKVEQTAVDVRRANRLRRDDTVTLGRAADIVDFTARSVP